MEREDANTHDTSGIQPNVTRNDADMQLCCNGNVSKANVIKTYIDIFKDKESVLYVKYQHICDLSFTLFVKLFFIFTKNENIMQIIIRLCSFAAQTSEFCRKHWCLVTG